MFRLTDNFVEFAKGVRNTRTKLVVACAFIHGPALHGAFYPQQSPLNAIHGFFEWLTAHGSQGVADWERSASGALG
jgi:hypothetical protein